MADTYGIVEIVIRARGWHPEMRTLGQLAVFGVMLTFCDQKTGTFTPTNPQVAEATGLHPSSVRRIVKELETVGALTRVGQRSVRTAEGIARGGNIPIWSVPPAPSDAHSGNPHPRPNNTPPAPKQGSTRAPEGAPLKVEKLKEEKESKTDPSPKKLDPQTCRHRAKDEDGYCTACGSQVP